MNNYVVRAMKTLNVLEEYIADADTLRKVWNGVSLFNHRYHRAIDVKNGATRIALITSDYVIKFDREDLDMWDDNALDTFGGCEQELDFYKYANQKGFGYLFAPITRVSMKSRNYYIMPRIRYIGKGDSDVTWWLDGKELDFVEEHLFDLHEKNYGFVKGRPCIIDYATGSF